MEGQSVRKPAVAGQFYPREPARLREVVEHYMDASGVEPAPDRVSVIVAPHAGYVYSGPTAGYVYGRVRGKQPKRVVLLGCSHRQHIDTASVPTAGAFDTPLGRFPIDEDFAARFAERMKARTAEPHLIEHSLEVQLPFLHEAIGVCPIVPVLFGGPPTDWHANQGAALADMLDEEDLVVASTDLSHYLSEEEANLIDRDTLEAILKKDWAALVKKILTGSCSMCGASAVVAAMACASARGADAWRLLDYRTSAKVSGDYDRVVGYGAVSMERAA